MWIDEQYAVMACVFQEVCGDYATEDDAKLRLVRVQCDAMQTFMNLLRRADDRLGPRFPTECRPAVDDETSLLRAVKQCAVQCEQLGDEELARAAQDHYTALLLLLNFRRLEREAVRDS